MPDPAELTVSEAAQQIRRQELSPLELADAVLSRIDRLDPILKAWVTIDRDAVLATARRYSQEAAVGQLRGALHGIPVGVKDIFHTAGMMTAAGSAILTGFTPRADATAVLRLKAAGAIILGKTATTEFAFTDPPDTRNPWNVEHTPGGSSSGSAAAVASGMCPAALGSQTAGSTLRPAAFCGIVGLKPTYGRISRRGVIPLSWSLDHVGILVRTVEDAATLLDALASRRGPSPSPDRTPRDLTAQRPPRIGVVEEYYAETADAEVWANTTSALQRLRHAGAQIEVIPLPRSFQASYAAHRIVMRVETAAYHDATFRCRSGEYRPLLRDFIASGLLIPGSTYLRAQRIRRWFRRDAAAMLRHVDCLLTPAAPTPAPPGLASTGDPSFNAPWTFVGFPAIALPSGLTRGGLPTGVQLVGRPFDEEGLLSAAAWCERVIGFEHRPHALG
jgi:Asp-tRNA(Asn)/Glu-tRNA(Gln) amidotransferase A subunit family amidase